MKKRGRPKLRLILDAATHAALQKSWKTCTDRRQRERLQAVRLATTGNHTYAEIAQIVGRSVTILQHWFAKFEKGGLEELLTRKHGGGRTSLLHKPKVSRALERGLRDGRWTSAPQVAAWLAEEHAIQMNSRSLYYWLKKAGGALKVPRPCHAKKNEAAAAAFKAHLYDRLAELPI